MTRYLCALMFVACFALVGCQADNADDAPKDKSSAGKAEPAEVR